MVSSGYWKRTTVKRRRPLFALHQVAQSISFGKSHKLLIFLMELNRSINVYTILSSSTLYPRFPPLAICFAPSMGPRGESTQSTIHSPYHLLWARSLRWLEW